MAKTNTPPSRKALTPSAASNSGAGAKGAAPELAPPSTALYVVGATPILFSGAYHAPGSTIELTEAQAARLGLGAAPAAASDSNDSNLE